VLSSRYIQCLANELTTTVPLGIRTMDESTFTGGGGLCSVKRTPFGEWKSACADSDFFDGSPDVPNRVPPGQ
jgi:hypothetical protein